MIENKRECKVIVCSYENYLVETKKNDKEIEYFTQ